MKKVLVADDTKNIRTLLSTCLELEGYEVLTANNGQQAYDLFCSETFDLAFLDIKMPEMSGTEVLKRIREIGINTPVIIITAFATVKNAVECTKLGAVAYLQKPFTADKVRSILREMNEMADACVLPCSAADKITELIVAGLYDEAISRLKDALSSEPSNPELYTLFGKAHEGIGDIEGAEKFYRAAEVFRGK